MRPDWRCYGGSCIGKHDVAQGVHALPAPYSAPRAVKEQVCAELSSAMAWWIARGLAARADKVLGFALHGRCMSQEENVGVGLQR
jgi:hypothetical protein